MWWCLAAFLWKHLKCCIWERCVLSFDLVHLYRHLQAIRSKNKEEKIKVHNKLQVKHSTSVTITHLWTHSHTGQPCWTIYKCHTHSCGPEHLTECGSFGHWPWVRECSGRLVCPGWMERSPCLWRLSRCCCWTCWTCRSCCWKANCCADTWCWWHKRGALANHHSLKRHSKACKHAKLLFPFTHQWTLQTFKETHVSHMCNTRYVVQTAFFCLQGPNKQVKYTSLS